jgi:5-methylcytosine-specific restriction endonuclease McrA
VNDGARVRHVSLVVGLGVRAAPDVVRSRHDDRGRLMGVMRVCMSHGIYEPGNPSIPRGRCPLCYREHNRGRHHRRVRAQVLAEETVCWLCGLPPTEQDPLTFDHVVPLAEGGKTSRANGRAAHRSCNSRRGARDTPSPSPAHRSRRRPLPPTHSSSE